MSGSIAFAFVLAALGGLLTGAFALPMKFVTRWKWENTWLAFSFFGFVLIPAVIIGAARRFFSCSTPAAAPPQLLDKLGTFFQCPRASDTGLPAWFTLAL